MVGIVVVSHSAALADGVVELARQMGGDELRLEAAGGLEDGAIGTDVERVRAAIERAMSDDGVLVLMDLGSALMSAEMAVELLEADGRVELSEAPFVEGAVAAAVASARGGASLDEVRAEARRAIEMKAAQLGAGDRRPPAARCGASRRDGPEQARIPVLNEIGLHARPAALVVELASRFDADLRLAKAGGAGPVSARSLTGLMTLVARQGDELLATASGPAGATRRWRRSRSSPRQGFGEGIADGCGVRAACSVRGRGPAAGRRRPELSGAAPAPSRARCCAGSPRRPGSRSARSAIFGEQLEAPPERPSQGPRWSAHRLESARDAARSAIERDRDQVARREQRRAKPRSSLRTWRCSTTTRWWARRGARIEAGAAAERPGTTPASETAAAWRALDDELLRERAADVEDVGRRVLAALAGREPQAGLQRGGVLVVSELTPAQAAALDPDLVRGIAAARGTATAHAAILARALGIPAAVGLGPSVLAIGEDTPVLLDGGEGTLLVAPSEAVAEQRAPGARAGRRAAPRGAAPRGRAGGHAGRDPNRGVGQPRRSRRGGRGRGARRGRRRAAADRVPVPRPARDPRRGGTGADARRRSPGELDGRPLIVRTLDVGADKPLPALPIAPEQNPFLGRRGIRLSLEHPELLATQLRAILRVAAEHPLKVMFPMVATARRARGRAGRRRAGAGRDRRGGAARGGDHGRGALGGFAGRAARRLGGLLLDRDQRPHPVHDGRRARERAGRETARRPAAGGPAAGARETVAGAEAHGRWVGVCGELAGDPAAARAARRPWASAS